MKNELKFQKDKSKVHLRYKDGFYMTALNTEDNLKQLSFEANGFLRHMVRNIVGTVVEVGQGKIGYNDFVTLFKAKDRGMAGVKAPPQGLFLTDVRYPAMS